MLITGSGRSQWEAEQDARNKLAAFETNAAIAEDLGRLFGPLVGHLISVPLVIVGMLFRPVTFVLWLGTLVISTGLFCPLALGFETWGPGTVGRTPTTVAEVAVLGFAGLMAVSFILSAPTQVRSYDHMDRTFSGLWNCSLAWKAVVGLVGLACVTFTLYLVLSAGMAVTWYMAKLPMARWQILPASVILRPWSLWAASPCTVVAGIYAALAAAGHRKRLVQEPRGY